MIEHYLMAVTVVSGVILFLLTAGPGSRLPLFPDRIFMFSLAISMIGAALFYFVRMFDPSDASAKWYSQWVNATARTATALSGSVILLRHVQRCKKAKSRARTAS